MSSAALNLVICQNCDTVHRPVLLARNEAAHCSCCDAVLARKHGLEIEQLLALTLAAALLFLTANLTPVLAIEFGGIRTEANVWTAALSLEQGWISAAALALALTMFLVPLLQIASLLWVLAFAAARQRAPAYRIALILLHWLRPWSMTEVFLLGALVVIVKLSAWVPVVPGEGMWALGGLTILLAILSRYDSGAWWSLVERAAS